MQAGPRDNRTFARRAAGQAKKGVRSTVQALPRGVRQRIAGLVLPGGPDRPATLDDAELIRRAAEVPFETWEQQGWHLTANHFYSTIPDTRELPDTLWQRESELPGIDMRDQQQLAFLEDAVARFGDELNGLPRKQADAAGGYFVDNGAFESVDAEVLYAMIRGSRPKRVLEIGSGWSTLLSMRALEANRAEGSEGRLTAVEPYPHAFVRAAVAARPDYAEMLDEQVQGLPLQLFSSLAAGDILFIDSSHVLRIGSDVQYEFLEILPRLQPGVLVHVHDIFLPGEYPRDWVFGPEHRFWNEQYLLQAYLIGNARTEVAWGSSWMHRRHPEALEKAIASYDRETRFPGSFWFRTL
jgi:predicted O-methyltransferase YrrM